MGRHGRSHIREVPPVHSREEEIGEYSSKDVEFDWPESYEPPYPLTEHEKQLLEQNRTEKADSVNWFMTQTRPVVDEELGNGAER